MLRIYLPVIFIFCLSACSSTPNLADNNRYLNMTCERLEIEQATNNKRLEEAKTNSNVDKFAKTIGSFAGVNLPSISSTSPKDLERLTLLRDQIEYAQGEKSCVPTKVNSAVPVAPTTTTVPTVPTS